MIFKQSFATLLLLCAATAYADTEAMEQECAKKLDDVIHSMETEVAPAGVNHNVTDATIRMVRKIQKQESSCAAYQAISAQRESDADNQGAAALVAGTFFV